MTNKWTTLVEEQTEQANASVNKVLAEVSASGTNGRKNKTFAIVLASVGVLLIGFGAWPFFSNGLLGDILNTDAPPANSNIFSNQPQTVDDVTPLNDGGKQETGSSEDTNSLPQDSAKTDPSGANPLSTDDGTGKSLPGGSPDSPPSPPDQVVSSDETTNLDNENLLDSEPINTTTPKDETILKDALPENDVPALPIASDAPSLDDPFADLGTEVTSGNLDLSALDILNTPTPTTDNSVPFRQNTHTGSVDKTVQVYGEDSANAAPENLHGAAPKTDKMAKSGPESWFLVLFALPIAFFLRRKKLFTA